MTILVTEMTDEMKKLEEQLQMAHKDYYTTNDFLVIRDESKDKLLKIANDYTFMKQLINIYPGFGKIRKYVEDYKILFICDKNKSDEIIKYLKINYGTDLEIGEVIDPIVNGHYMCELFKANCIE